MSLFNCACRRNCALWSVIGALAVGVVTAFLQITGTITVAPVFSYIPLGIAVVYLAVAFIVASADEGTVSCPCGCTALAALLVGALGTIVSALVILAFAFVATSIIGAIVLGVELFFFALMLASTACLAKCKAGC